MRRRNVFRVTAALVAAASAFVGIATDTEIADATAVSAAAVIEPGSADELVRAERVDPTMRRVLMVGDSTLASVRNYVWSQRLFRGFHPVLDAHGCRRLIWPSCFSDSDFAVPNTVQEAIRDTPGELDVVIVMSGYNDWHDPFGSFVDAIVATARSKGADEVVFLTLSAGTFPETSATAIGVYAENTQMLWASRARNPSLRVADWRNYAYLAPGWFEADGVHLTQRGAFGLADYMTRWMAHLDGRPCPQPLYPGGPIQDPCPNPNTLGRRADVTGLYGA